MAIILRKLLPEIVLSIILLVIMIGIQWQDPNSEDKIIQSDGTGYYAYLPAVFIQKDLSFQSTALAEEYSTPLKPKPFYLVKNQAGRTVNKYYPGVAVLQAPFFGAAYLLSNISEDEITGYSSIFYYFFQFGSLIYGVLGFYFLRNYLILSGITKKTSIVTSFALFFGTTLFYQIVFTPSLSHHYSFFLFALFAFLIKRYQQDPTRKKSIAAGVVFGLIALVRPVNILIILAVPFILGTKQENKLFFQKLFQLKNKHLLLLTLAFLASISPIFIFNYLQSGNLMNWSYQGEGFNFSHPKMWQVLFSFRTGFFTHTPIAFLALIGCCYLFTFDRYRSFLWIAYFLVISFTIGAWWSWDFGGFFGNRIFTEHIVLLSFLIAYLIQHFNYKRVLNSTLVLLVTFMISRTVQLEKGVISHRFTAETYLKSIGKITHLHTGEFSFSREVQPFGKKTKEWKLTTDSRAPFTFNSGTQFGFTTTFILPKEKKSKCYYFTLNVKKKLLHSSDFKDVYFVMDALDTVSNERYYTACPMYEFFKEGATTSKNLVLEQAYCDNGWRVYDQIGMYIYNPKGKEFVIEDFYLVVEEFTSK